MNKGKGATDDTSGIFVRTRPALQRYVGMKRALGRQFDSATHALLSLDRLLAKELKDIRT